MTATVTKTIIDSVMTSQYGPLSNGMGLIVVLLLVILLVGRVLLDAMEEPSQPRRTWAFDPVVSPLLIILLVLVGLRFASILGLI